MSFLLVVLCGSVRGLPRWPLSDKGCLDHNKTGMSDEVHRLNSKMKVHT